MIVEQNMRFPTKTTLVILSAIAVIVNVLIYPPFSHKVRRRVYKLENLSRIVTDVERYFQPCKLNGSVLRSDVSPEQRLEEVERNPSVLRLVKPGGVYTPPNCKSTDNVAIIVPFRDRAEHRVIFLRHIHSFLQKQQLSYRIFLIELTHTSQFNRALLMNAGFMYASNITNYNCYILHDVDLLPTNEFNFYNCSGATHFASNRSNSRYKMPYATYFGGVSGFSEKAFRSINGCSNLFYGWGLEDDDLYNRIIGTIPEQFSRQPLDIGVYKALGHEKAKKDTKKLLSRETLMSSSLARIKTDGLSTLNVTFVQTENRDLYTWLLIDVNEESQIQWFKKYARARQSKRNATSRSEKILENV